MPEESGKFSILMKIIPTVSGDITKINLLGLKKYLDQFQDRTLFACRKLDHFVVKYTYHTGDLTEKITKKEPFTVNGVPCTAYISSSLNARKGVVTHPEVQYLSPDEMIELLDDPQIFKVTKPQPASATAIIYWKRMYYANPPTPPSTVQLGWDTVVVRPYVPRPIRCHNCQQYGHKAEVCHVAKPICAKCATSGHTADDCNTEQLFCPACKGNHAANDPKCSRWVEEKQIVSLKQRHGISYKDALLRLRQPDAAKTDTPPEKPEGKPTQQPDDQTSTEDDDDMSEDSSTEDDGHDEQPAPPEEKQVDVATSAPPEKRKDDGPPFQAVSSRKKRRGRGKP